MSGQRVPGAREIRPGYWQVRIYSGTDPLTGKGKYVTRGVKGSVRAAARLRREIERDIENGKTRGDAITFGTLVDKVLTHLEGTLSPTTMRGYRSMAKHLDSTRLAEMKLAKLTRNPEAIDAVIDKLRHDGRSEQTLLNYFRFIHRVLDQARRWRYVSTNVAELASPPRVHNLEIEAPPTNEVLTLIEAGRKSRNPDLGVAFELLAATGARAGEVCGLRWSDIDLATGLIRVRRNVITLSADFDPVANPRVTVVAPRLGLKDTKAHAKRKLTVGEQTMANLIGWRAEADARWDDCPEEAFVLTDTYDPLVPWNPQRLTQAFDRIRERKHFKWTLHGLRRWNTSELLDAGEDVTVVAGRQGHRDKATTHKRYAHMKRAADQRAAAIIDAGLYVAKSDA